jgi:hypothetical protein
MSVLNREPPSRYKNQLNGKTATENYIDFKREQQTEFEIDRNELKKQIEVALSDILATLNLPL